MIQMHPESRYVYELQLPIGLINRLAACSFNYFGIAAPIGREN